MVKWRRITATVNYADGLEMDVTISPALDKHLGLDEALDHGIKDTSEHAAAISSILLTIVFCDVPESELELKGEG